MSSRRRHRHFSNPRTVFRKLTFLSGGSKVCARISGQAIERSSPNTGFARRLVVKAAHARQKSPVALSVPRPRTWSSAVPTRFLLLGLAAIVAIAGPYLFFFGNPLASTQKVLTYPTSVASTGTLQVTVAGTGPISNAINFPLKEVCEIPGCIWS